ncbi:MAG: hypothetical protein K2X75_09435 [Burkholderiaceae bacterium]|jgi:hypothetical protein|nr:hypothetical protein [Burkholderiaceae bacterium]
MRVFLLILMMALLPLRAGLGDVMAMQVAGPDAAASTRPAAGHDCHEAQQPAGADHVGHHITASVSAEHMQADPACSDCAVCHAAALPGTLLPPVLVAAGTAPPQSPALTPISADPVPGLKPPIG